MTKRILIVGTSHSEASCATVDYGNGSFEYSTLPKGTRWFDYFEKDYGAHVTKLARSGCSSLDQYMAVAAYFKDHPDAEFDIAMIEGRGTEPNFNTPVPNPLKQWNRGYDYLDLNRWMYDRWLDPEYRKAIDNMEVELWDRISPHDVSDNMYDVKDPDHYLVQLLEKYTLSDLHHVQNLAFNHALCELVNTRSTITKWFTMQFTGHKQVEYILPMYLDMLGDFILEKEEFLNNKPETNFFYRVEGLSDTVIESELFCKCGHMNEAGHELYWKEIIKPKASEWFK